MIIPTTTAAVIIRRISAVRAMSTMAFRTPTEAVRDTAADAPIGRRNPCAELGWTPGDASVRAISRHRLELSAEFGADTEIVVEVAIDDVFEVVFVGDREDLIGRIGAEQPGPAERHLIANAGPGCSAPTPPIRSSPSPTKTTSKTSSMATFDNFGIRAELAESSNR